MLLASDFKVKLAKRYFKILFLSAAFKETFVFLGMPSQGKDVLVHCDKQGKILYERLFDHNVDSFAMMNDRQAVVLETRHNKITVVNLEQYDVVQHNHQFMNEEADQADIETFPDTRLLCVKELGRYNDNRLKLSYYSYPLKGGKPDAVYESKEDEWTYQHLIRKGNNHSMIIWFKGRHDEQFQFKTFDLRDDPKGSYHHYKIKNSIGEQYNLARVECAVTSAWQTRKGQLLAVCISNKTQAKAENPDGIINNNFIIDLDLKTVRQAKFYFQKRFNDYQIDYMNLGPICMFRTFQFLDGNPLPSPVYYINNQTQSIVSKEQWLCSYLTKYFIPGYDSSTIMQGQFQNNNVEGFTMKIKKVMDPKEIALHFMLHINDDFDDDLLQDSLELLGFI